MANDSETNSAAWNAAGQAASAGIAAIGQSVNTKNQFKRSKELMALQMQNQERMNESAHMRQLQMWKDTNFDAQMQQMKKAGLNPALMYGQGGGGGTTVGSNTAGSASAGFAPQMMDMGAIVSAIKMVAELGLTKALTKTEEAKPRLIENQADKAYYDAANVNYADPSNEYIQEFMRGMRASNTLKEEQVNETRIKNEINGATSEQQKNEIINKAILSEMKVYAEKANIELTEEQTRKIWHDIRIGWTNAGFNGLSKIVGAALK